MKINHIYCMDNIQGLHDHVPDKSVDLTVTSPPYDNLRDYNGYSFDFAGLANELYRVTKMGGAVVWIVNDASVKGSETGTSFKQALYFKEIGFNLHDTMIYKKRNPVPLTHNRYQPSFEYMFVFSRGKPKTFHPLMVEAKYGGKREFHGTKRTRKGKLVRPTGHGKLVNAYRLKHNVWEYNVGYGNSTTDKIAYEHPAIFPEQLVEDHILSWSNPEDIVLDPFIGSGTTAKMAIKNNRSYIGFEISQEYVEIARTRIDTVKVIPDA